MLYDCNATVCLAAVRDETPEAPLVLAESGLWVALISSGAVLTAGSPPLRAEAGMLVLGRGPLSLVPDGACHLLAALLTGRAPQDMAAALPQEPYVARGESCPGAAEQLGRLAEAQGLADAFALSQMAYALLCALANADAAAPALPPLVAAAVEDIRRNYGGLYGVEELSERLGVSKSHLVRTFHAAMEVSPGRYLTQVRLDAACRLLLHREYSLDVIASLCGFSGANYLCRVFKKEYGVSPMAWRAAAWERAAPAPLPQNTRERELYV